MPAIGNAKISMSTIAVHVTGTPAHALQLTATIRMTAAAITNRLDRVFTTGRSSAVRLHGVECRGDGAARAVELALFNGVDPDELAALHLHADEALAADLPTDVRR